MATESLQPGRMRSDVPLARYTAARLGGPADWLYSARDSSEELVAALGHAREREMPFRALGGGANVLIADEGLRGLVLINRVQQVAFGDAWLRASAGSGLMALARQCQARGLAGLEWAVSVPGTLGGAVINNAGAHGGDMAGMLLEATLLEADGSLKTLSAADLAYAYRNSCLKRRAIAGLACAGGDAGAAAGRPGAHRDADGRFQRRAQAQSAARRQPGQHISQPPGRFRRPPD